MTPIELMKCLRRAKIHFTMTTVRDDALMFQITIPGERWELEVFSDGHFELEKFVAANGVDVIDADKLKALISEYSDEK